MITAKQMRERVQSHTLDKIETENAYRLGEVVANSVTRQMFSRPERYKAGERVVLIFDTLEVYTYLSRVEVQFRIRSGKSGRDGYTYKKVIVSIPVKSAEIGALKERKDTLTFNVSEAAKLHLKDAGYNVLESRDKYSHGDYEVVFSF